MVDTGTTADGAADADTTARRRRPRNRKAQILTAAAEAFSDRGYHPVGIDDIASTVGISGPALYRHFPTKYALFVHTVSRLADLLLAATDSSAIVTEENAGEPEARLDAVIRAVIRTTIDNRRTGGLYRWEGRYLVGDDRAALRDSMNQLHARVRTPLQELRPELSSADAALLATAAISVVASITSHRSALSSKQIEELMLNGAWSVLRVDPSAEVGPVHRAAAAEAMLSTREVLLRQSILLFYRHGYHDVSIEDIGAAAGITASSVYRHFPSKAELLAAAFHRANERLTSTLAEAMEQSRSSVETVHMLARLYTELTFEHGELVAVYFAELGNLPADQRTNLRNVQRRNIDEWAQVLRDARPGLGVVTSRFLVHAALGLVFDVGRSVHFDRSSAATARVQQSMTAVMLGSDEAGLRP
ncbi:TetR/AcrR family transcriptional regulator [Rhodococcoides yunnanense]|uniref:TetR/AcrR family transcriptional regulator n=1 Tax=Rhodococcoides yunnanense TaxID=278209 RepID=UPI000932CED0|nr:TetR/AcrR family transcriptional regulator [Rhodococcus yunnanensis]